MFASLSISTLLILASAVVAQDTVATSPFVSPMPTTEEVFTIQTSMPASTPVDPWACYEVCMQEPCPSCPSGSKMSIPPVSESVVTAIDPSLSSLTGIMSIPPLEIPTGSVVSVITDPSLSTVTGIMSIPPLETPVSSGLMSIPPGETPISTGSSATTASSGSATRSAPAQVTTNAAVSITNGYGVSCMVAVAGALALL